MCNGDGAWAWEGRISKSILSLLLAAGVFISSTSQADAQYDQRQGEANIVPDELNVNLAGGASNLPTVSMSIGGVIGGLQYSLFPVRGLDSRDWVSDNYHASWTRAGTMYGEYSVTLGGRANQFQAVASNSYAVIFLDGSTISKNLENFTYISGNGTEVKSNYGAICSGGLSKYDNITEIEQLVYASTIIKPNGEKFTYSYLVIYGNGCEVAHRLQSVRNNFGYMIHYDYASDDQRSLNWRLPISVILINGAVDYCPDTALRCSALTQNWPKLSLSRSTQPHTANWTDSVIGPDGGVTVYNHSYIENDYPTLTISKNGLEVLKQTYNTCCQPFAPKWWVSSVKRDGEFWIYTHPGAVADPLITVQRANPLGGTKIVSSDKYAKIHSITDENGRVNRYLYDLNNLSQPYLLRYKVRPEGTLDGSGNPLSDYTKYDYDARGNIVQTTVVAKAGSGLANIVTSTGFDATCSNRKTCNQPNWTRDALGRQTDFTYDPNHGGVLSQIAPAPTSGAARPLKLNTYAQRWAWIKNASGVLVQSPDPVWLITSSTECQTAAGSNSPVCDSAAPQTVTNYEYGASGTGEAMLVKGIAVSSGGMTFRTCYAYDVFHRRVSETKPNANLQVCP